MTLTQLEKVAVDCQEQICLKVLKTWKGTPEELGADLIEATLTIPSWASKEQRRRDLERKISARNRIKACEGGAELIELEEAFMRRR